MKKFSFQAKLSLAFIVLMVTTLTATTYFIYQETIAQQKEELRLRILGFAKLAGLMIDADKHSRIKPKMESQNTALYKEIKNVLKKIRDSDPLIDSVYTMIKTNKESIWMFVVDSGDRKRNAAYCGERYDVSGMPEMRIAFDRASVDSEFTVDKWGTWLSGYAPIRNSRGEPAAIVGLDVSAESVSGCS